MKLHEIVGKTIVFDDAYTGEERYGRIDRVQGDDAVICIISKDEAGPSPIKVKARTDTRIAALTRGTGRIE